MFLSDYSIIIQCHIVTRDGKEPSLLEFGSVRVLLNIRVLVRFGFLMTTGSVLFEFYVCC